MSNCKWCKAELAREIDDKCGECYETWVWIKGNPDAHSRMVADLYRESMESTVADEKCSECLGFGGESLNDGRVWKNCSKCSDGKMIRDGEGHE